MIFSTGHIKVVKESVLSHNECLESLMSVLSHLVEVFHLFRVLHVLLVVPIYSIHDERMEQLVEPCPLLCPPEREIRIAPKNLDLSSIS